MTILHIMKNIGNFICYTHCCGCVATGNGVCYLLLNVRWNAFSLLYPAYKVERIKFISLLFVFILLWTNRVCQCGVSFSPISGR